ncbi:MAG: adenylyl-sulfate kinase [Candidatus Falkowbacteria bacterium]
MKTKLDFIQGFKALTELALAAAKPVVVLIAGASGSGKSHLAKLLSAKLLQCGILTTVIGQDDYFRDCFDPDLPLDSQGRGIFDLPASYLDLELASDIRMLLSGFTVQGPLYDKKVNLRSLTKKTLEAAPVVIVEGLYAILALADNDDMPIIKIYVEADSDICLRSRIRRDTVAFGISAEKVEKFYNERVLPYAKEALTDQAKLADLIIVNDHL